jgi:hypothetical protein
MSYTPNKLSTVSAIGINSDTVTSGGNWSGNTYTGAGEENDYAYIGVNLQVDESGVLYFDFSQDGTNWSSYPVNGFDITSGINEVHTAWKGGRYMRPRFIGTGGRSFFRLKTYYSNLPLPLSAPLNQTIGSDQDATVVRSVGIGQNPTGSYVNEVVDGVAFQTVANLATGATFNSDIIDAQGYTQVQTHIVSDQDGTLGFKFCSTSNCSGTTVGQNGVERYLSIPYSSADGFQLFSAPAFTPYVQYAFTNAGTGTTTQLFYETKLLTKGLSGQLVALNSNISPAMVANLGRNVIVGQDLAGNFRNAGTDSKGTLKVNISNPLTAFGELRVAEMTPLLQVMHPYELNLDLLSTGNTTASGNIIYNTGTTMVEINSGAATSSSGVLNTRKLVKYRNGQGLMVRYTALFDTAVSGNTQWVGWGDSTDGYFFGYSGTSYGILRRNSGTGETFIPQTSWNIDKMDGTSSRSNPSGQLLDPTKGNVYQLQAQWLGFGAVNFFIESSETGQFEPVHQIKYSNLNTGVSIINPTFPLWIESTNTTNSTNITIKNGSLAAFNEGVIRYTGPNKAFGNAKATTTNTVVFSLRNPTTYKGKTNRSRIRLESLNIYSDQSNADPVTFQLQLDPTLATASFASFGNYTAIETDIAATLTTAGTVIFQGGTSEVDSKVIDLIAFDLFLNPGETLSIIGNGANTGSGAALTWVEDL